MITLQNIDSLALGATLLSSGGGGSVDLEISFIKELITKNGNLELINPSSLEDDALILPVAFVGPIVGKEKILNEKYFSLLLQEFKKYYGKLPTTIMPGEIGGANGIAPLIASSMTGIPILDGDLLGRAFPEVQMASVNITGDVSCAPTFIIEQDMRSTVLLTSNIQEMEKQARAISSKTCSLVGVYCMNGAQAKTSIIKNSITKAIQLGDILRFGLNVLSELSTKTNGKVLFSGTITHIKREITNGFLTGEIEISNKKEKYIILYKNEYLVIYHNGNIITSTPEIISILDMHTHIPIASEKISLNTEVTVFTFSADDIWYTNKGLELVGLQAHNLKRKF